MTIFLNPFIAALVAILANDLVEAIFNPVPEEIVTQEERIAKTLIWVVGLVAMTYFINRNGRKK